MATDQASTKAPEIDRFSARVVVVAVCLLAAGALAGSYTLTRSAMNASTVQDAVALMGVGTGFFGFAGLLIGGLVNAMTLRFGSNAKELQQVVGMAYVPGSQEGMSAGVWPPSNVDHDPARAAALGPIDPPAGPNPSQVTH